MKRKKVVRFKPQDDSASHDAYCVRIGFECVRIGSVGFEAACYRFVGVPELAKRFKKRVFSHALIG